MLFPAGNFLSLLSVLLLNIVLLTSAQNANVVSVVMGKKQYYIDKTETGNFYQGVNFCAQYDMKLASIENKDEYNRLFTLLKVNDMMDTDYWLSGISYGENKPYIWLGTGTKVVDQPSSSSGSNVKCLYTNEATFKYQGDACDNSYRFICEKPLEPNCGKYGQCRYSYSYYVN